MRGFLLLVCASAVAAASAEPVAPTAQQVEQWAAFPKPVNLKAEDVTEGWRESGKVIWYYSYRANDDRVPGYGIALYKAGGLHGENRAALEKLISEHGQKIKLHLEQLKAQELARIKQLEQQHKIPADEKERLTAEILTMENNPFFRDVAKDTKVETRPDGRKVFFLSLPSPDGGGVEVFTTIGKYDLLLNHTIMGRNDRKAGPTAELSDIFKKLEKHIGDGK